MHGSCVASLFWAPKHAVRMTKHRDLIFKTHLGRQDIQRTFLAIAAMQNQDWRITQILGPYVWLKQDESPFKKNMLGLVVWYYHFWTPILAKLGFSQLGRYGGTAQRPTNNIQQLLIMVNLSYPSISLVNHYSPLAFYIIVPFQPLSLPTTLTNHCH